MVVYVEKRHSLFLSLQHKALPGDVQVNVFACFAWQLHNHNELITKSRGWIALTST